KPSAVKILLDYLLYPEANQSGLCIQESTIYNYFLTEISVGIFKYLVAIFLLPLFTILEDSIKNTESSGIFELHLTFC
ncbi:MAG: hypothetical protein L0J63_11370, partial [Tetragenococcus koreensis]|nr:hypothetical protein [Tetragenococcus koreensis]